MNQNCLSKFALRSSQFWGQFVKVQRSCIMQLSAIMGVIHPPFMINASRIPSANRKGTKLPLAFMYIH
jgi:hypothetical protein